jgi:uncharacterized circularly permuted ATP-grasp superfamily protein/uncharacterized alpha-E superfamily protein
MSSSATESDPRLSSTWPYRANRGFHDEMMTADGEIRPHWRGLVNLLNQVGPEGLAVRWQEGRRLIHDNGVTYNVYGDPQSTERPWPLDPVPLMLNGDEWGKIEVAIIQRATLFNQMLADIYGPQQLLRQRKYPSELVFPHPGFLRPCCGAPLPGGIHLHSYAADIARSPDGHWWVLADRLQAPSGAGYALENRLVSGRVLPDLFRAENVRRLAPFFQSYRDTLRSLAPKRENPRIVLLTPGPYNETYFEHAFLARYLGYTLVEGGDLTVRNGCVYMKTLGGLLPVDVIVRRQDDTYCDPLELRSDSMLGVAGLVQAVMSGNVAVANALGSGLLESAAPAAFVPALCKHLLGEELKMPSIATWWCGDPATREWVADHLTNVVIKPATPNLDFEPIFGPKLSLREREGLMARIKANPGAYVAQEQVSLSTVPMARDGVLHTRHLVVRVFAVASGDTYIVMPGGLSRITASLDSLVVSMQHGGGSKDTWVLADAAPPQFSLLRKAAGPLPVSRATFDLPSRMADNLYWLGRYLERFEGNVRTVRAVLPRLYQDADPVSSAALAVCRQVLVGSGYLGGKAARGQTDSARSGPAKPDEPGDDGDPDPTAARPPLAESEVLSLIANRDQRRSLRSGVAEIRRVAWLLRDRISADAWRVLKHLDQEFTATPPPEPLRVSWAQDLLDRSVISLSAFSGLATENMTRGHGWRFLDMGRRLERGVQTVKLIRHGFGLETLPGDAELATVLEIADSSMTYRSRYLNSMQPDLVLDLLLLDEGNPRSAAFQVSKLRKHVDRLPESHPPSGIPKEARLSLSMLTSIQLAEASELIHADALGRLAALDQFTGRLLADLLSLSDALARVYFTHAVPSRQLTGR